MSGVRSTNSNTSFRSVPLRSRFSRVLRTIGSILTTPCRDAINLYLQNQLNFGRLRFFTCYLLRLSESLEVDDLRHAAVASRTLRSGRVFMRGNAGGADRDRTGGLRLAKPALSQLSYSPRGNEERQVGQGRVELPTSRLSGVRSNHLSYWPRMAVFAGPSQARGPPTENSRSLKTESHHFRIDPHWLLAIKAGAFLRRGALT